MQHRLQTKQAGFTTIEIIFLLIVIAILSGLILATHKGIQKKLDNNERQRDINSLRLSLETYYSRHSQYPTLAEINNPAWRAVNMSDLAKESLRDPASSSFKLVAQPAPKVYAYAVASAHDHACDDIRVICTQYTLTGTLSGGTYVKQNLD